MMFLRYDKKDKRLFLILHSLVILGILGAGLLAVKYANLDLYTLNTDTKMQIGFGTVIVGIIVMSASFHNLKWLFKFKSVTFITAFASLFLLKSVIDILVITLGFVSIPLLFNDLFITPYFRVKNMTKYFDDYKHMANVDVRS